MIVRRARPEDAPCVSSLMEQLGYSVPVPEIAKRLARRDRERKVFVAENDTGVVAWAAVRAREDFVGGRYAEIEGFVVDEKNRSAGIGAHLLGAAERWARDRGCDAMRVRSNVIRQRAHVFYQRHGYERVKAQFSFRKAL